MAQPKITIQFDAKGDQVVVKAIEKLDKATKALIKVQEKLAGEGQKQVKSQNRNKGAIDKVNVSLALQGSNWKKAGISAKLYTQAVKGNKLALAKVQVATKKHIESLQRQKKGLLETQHSTRILGGSFAVLRSKMLLASFAGGLFSMTIGKLVKAQGEQEKAEKKLSVAIGKRSAELLDFASAQQQVTIYGDEETITAMSLIGAYTDNEDAIKKLTKASMDLASAKGMDLRTATDLVAKSVFSSTNALSRYGVTIEGAVGSTERLEDATNSLSQMYGGQARAEAETTTGSIKQMWNAMGDTAESIGSLLAPAVILISKELKGASEGAGEFAKEMKNIIDTGNALGIVADNSKESFEKQLIANENIVKELQRQQISGRSLTHEQKDQLMFAQHMLKVLQNKILVLESIEQIEKDAQAREELRSPSEESAWLNTFIEQQKELVAQKQQEIDQVDFLIEMYPELARVLGLVEDESDNTADNMKKLAELASRTAGSFAQSLLMGDDLTDAIKRATINMVVMVAEAKLMEYFTRKAKENMEAIQTGGTSTIFRGLQKLGSFIFGHDGGMVTANGIKRFHNGGLASDEVPAVLQQGEFVLSRSAVQSIGLESVRAMNEGRGGSNVEVHIHGGVVQEDYVMNELLPAINKAKALA